MKIRELVAKLAQDSQKRNGRGKCIMAGKINNEVIMYERWKNSLRITKK
jgi:hypothetical protein